MYCSLRIMFEFRAVAPAANCYAQTLRNFLDICTLKYGFDSPRTRRTYCRRASWSSENGTGVTLSKYCHALPTNHIPFDAWRNQSNPSCSSSIDVYENSGPFSEASRSHAATLVASSTMHQCGSDRSTPSGTSTTKSASIHSRACHISSAIPLLLATLWNLRLSTTFPFAHNDPRMRANL